MECAHNMLSAVMNKQQIDVAFTSEINRRLSKGSKWYTHSSQTVAIKLTNNSIQPTRIGEGEGFVYMETKDQIFVSCYFRPAHSCSEIERGLQQISQIIGGTQKQTYIGGDFNAKSPTWGGTTVDNRGTALEEWAASHQLICLNHGDTPTYNRGSYGSFIDVTFCNSRALRQSPRWRILEQESLSDHRYLLVEARMGQQTNKHRSSRMSEIPKDLLTAEFQVDLLRRPPETGEELQRTMMRACKVIRSGQGNQRKLHAYWWSDEIAQLHSTCVIRRRELARENRRTNGNPDLIFVQRQAESKRVLRTAIAKSKEEHWAALCKDVDESPWGDGYRIVTGNWDRKIPRIPDDLQQKAVSVLFPKHAETQYEVLQVHEAPEFSIGELCTALERLKPKKSAGPDGISSINLRYLVQAAPENVLRIMNDCLAKGIFPDKWKRAKLLLLHKEGKPKDDPAAYRPICLLDSIGKLLEQLIAIRLNQECQEKEILNERQFGFRHGRSTIDALSMVTNQLEHAKTSKGFAALVTVDIRNAFNSASWQNILRVLKEEGVSPYLRRIISSYLSKRTIRVPLSTGVKELSINSGVPQGSVLGPILWNILYNGVLKLSIARNARLVAYADDLAVVGVGKCAGSLKDVVNGTLGIVAKWMASAGLQIAPEKSEAVVVTSANEVPRIKFKILGKTIVQAEAVKYLGLWIDERLSYHRHIVEAAARSRQKSNALCRLMPNLGGARSSRRRVFGAVVSSISLYGAQIWADKLTEDMKIILERPQRLIALRVVAAYRTVGKDAALLLAQMAPLSITAVQRRRAYQKAPMAKGEVLSLWQDRWDDCTTGRWTHLLIPDIDRWLNRPHGETDFWLTQFLTGIGAFDHYLQKIGAAPSGLCGACGVPDTAEHCILRCPEYASERVTASWIDGLAPQLLLIEMLEDTVAYQEVGEMCRKILLRRRESRTPTQGYGYARALGNSQRVMR